MAARPDYRPDIDGLRALAVLLVVGFHAFPEWNPGGFIGVDIFFVISGFLISTILFASIERGTFSLVGFYSRRIRRIFPALVMILVAALTLGWFVLVPEDYSELGKHVACGAGFVSNFMLWRESGYFDVAAETKPLLLRCSPRGRSRCTLDGHGRARGGERARRRDRARGSDRSVPCDPQGWNAERSAREGRAGVELADLVECVKAGRAQVSGHELQPAALRTMRPSAAS